MGVAGRKKAYRVKITVVAPLKRDRAELRKRVGRLLSGYRPMYDGHSMRGVVPLVCDAKRDAHNLNNTT